MRIEWWSFVRTGFLPTGFDMGRAKRRNVNQITIIVQQVRYIIIWVPSKFSRSQQAKKHHHRVRSYTPKHQRKTSSATGILIRFLTRIRESERRTTERERDKTHCWVLETRLTTYRCSALSPHQAPLATRPALLHQVQTREVQAQAGTMVRSG